MASQKVCSPVHLLGPTKFMGTCKKIKNVDAAVSSKNENAHWVAGSPEKAATGKEGCQTDRTLQGKGNQNFAGGPAKSLVSGDFVQFATEREFQILDEINRARQQG